MYPSNHLWASKLQFFFSHFCDVKFFAKFKPPPPPPKSKISRIYTTKTEIFSISLSKNSEISPPKKTTVKLQHLRVERESSTKRKVYVDCSVRGALLRKP